MTLRDATESDLPAIVGIYNATIPGRMVTSDLEPVSVASRVPWFREHHPATRPLWVVEEDGALRAWLSFNSFRNRAAYRPTSEISLYVDAASRRRGFGRYLLGEAIARAPACGLSTLLGFIWAHNEPSLLLFQRFGFERWGCLPRTAIMDGIERDVVIVGRRVGAR